MDLGNLATLGAIAENKQTRGLRRAYFLKTSLEFQPRFFILPLVFPEKTRLHPRNSTILGYNPSEILRPKTKTPLEIPHDFLINPGNSALFFINPCENPLLFIIQSVPTPENSISLTALSPPVFFFFLEQQGKIIYLIVSSEQNYRQARPKPSGLTLDYEPNYNEIKKKNKTNK